MSDIYLLNVIKIVGEINTTRPDQILIKPNNIGGKVDGKQKLSYTVMALKINN